MDPIEKQITSEHVSVRSPEQLSFVWVETLTEAPSSAATPLRAPPDLPKVGNESETLIETQTRIVKTVFFALLGMALAAIHYLEA